MQSDNQKTSEDRANDYGYFICWPGLIMVAALLSHLATQAWDIRHIPALKEAACNVR